MNDPHVPTLVAPSPPATRDAAPPEAVLRMRIEIPPRTAFLVLGILAGVWVMGQLVTVLSVIVVALVLVGTFDPLVAWLEDRGLKRGRSLVMVFVGAGVVLLGVVFLMVPPLMAQLAQLLVDAPADRDRFLAAVKGSAWAAPLVSAVKDLPLDTLPNRAGQMMVGYSLVLFEAIGYGMSTMFLAIYLLADPARAKGMLYSVTPRHFHVKLAKMLLELKVIVGGYMRGQLITSVAISAFVFVLLTALRADNALPIALFAGLTDIIPFVGGYIASTPVVVAVTPQGTTITVIVFALMILYQEFESRILVPRVYGRVLRLHPAIVLVALLVGGSVAGILGALLALPIAAGLQMVIRELRVELPGESRIGSTDLERDQRASLVYEQLSEGVDATEAGKIADDLAASARKSEAAGPPPELEE